MLLIGRYSMERGYLRGNSVKVMKTSQANAAQHEAEIDDHKTTSREDDLEVANPQRRTRVGVAPISDDVPLDGDDRPHQAHSEEADACKQKAECGRLSWSKQVS